MPSHASNTAPPQVSQVSSPDPILSSPSASLSQHLPLPHSQPPQPPPSTSPAVVASTWTEPPWSGWIETTGDALIILEAARRGLIPRVTRRLVDSERKMITSGSVFVFDEDESGIKRWTDGFFWSPSRILGNFLLYRETDKRGAGHRGRATDTQEASSSSLLVNEHTNAFADANKDLQSLSRPKGEISSLGLDKHRERSLVGSLTNSYKFKPDGMMKKTFSLTIGGVSQHLISYYKIEDVEQGRLRTPSSLPELAALDISPEYLDKTHFRNPPKVDYDVDGVPRYRGEADEAELSPRTTISAPLSTGQPLLLDSRNDPDHDGLSGRRSKRFEPYNSVSKRSRKGKLSVQGSGSSADGQSLMPASPTSTMPGQSIRAGPYPGQESPQQAHFYGGGYYQPSYPITSHMYAPPPGAPYAQALPSPPSSGPTASATMPSPPPTGVVSPTAPPGGSMPQHAHAYASYAATGTGTDPNTGSAAPPQSSNGGTPAHLQYSYYPSSPPMAPAGHYPAYTSMAWSSYTYGPTQAMAVGAPVGKAEEGESNVHASHAQAQQTVGAEDA